MQPAENTLGVGKIPNHSQNPRRKCFYENSDLLLQVGIPLNMDYCNLVFIFRVFLSDPCGIGKSRYRFCRVSSDREHLSREKLILASPSFLIFLLLYVIYQSLLRGHTLSVIALDLSVFVFHVFAIDFPPKEGLVGNIRKGNYSRKGGHNQKTGHNNHSGWD